MSWNIKTPGDYINGPLTVAGVTQFNSNVGIGGPAQTFVRLDVVSGNRDPGGQGGTLTLGADMDSTSTRTGNTRKGAFVNAPHYSATEEKVFIIAADNDVSTNRLLIGGGYSGYNAATQIEFYTASSNTTATGSLGAILNNTGFGLGVAPAHAFHLRSANSAIAMIHSTNTNGPYVIFQNSTGNFGDIGSEAAITGSGSAGNLALNARTTGSLAFCISDSVKARLLLGGAFVLNGGNASANGTGIAFPAAQSASTDANTLDDYEEGTWTGTLNGSISAPTTPVTAPGKYTKVGRVVSVQIAFEAANTTGASGAITITGLPFSNSSGIRSLGSAGAYLGGNFTGTIASVISTGVSFVELMGINSGAVWTSVDHNPGTSRFFWVNVTYTV